MLDAGQAEWGRFRPDDGSFRDRANRVYDDGSVILRGVDATVSCIWNLVEKEEFFRDLTAEGKIVATKSACDLKPAGVQGAGEWSAFLMHDRIPFLSYPYEWSFGMLKDAALLHLDLLERAIPAGWTLKDATAYNIQWIGARPVFIDIPSLEPYRKGDPWVGYRQFCMMFLYPLMFRAYKGIDYLPFLRGNLEGIDPQTANHILSGAARFKKGVLGHVYLHAKMEQRHTALDLDEAKALKEGSGSQVTRRQVARHSEAMVLGTIQGLRRTVEKLSIPETRTTWGSYDMDHSYAENSFEAKRDFVAASVQAKLRKLTWDLGCNTGTFSRIAASNSEYVLALDGDRKAIERLYQSLKASGPKNILPLVMDLGNVSPDQGWRGRERKALVRRGRPDLILCLALIHHIVISANIPVQEFIGWLREFDADVVLEWVGPDDEMTQILLRNRVNQYGELSLERFEKVIGESFNVIQSKVLKGGVRKIYYLEPG